jgi:hypothetical protein
VKKRSLKVKQWRSRKRAEGLRPLSLWLDTETYSQLRAMAHEQQTSPAHIMTLALRSLEPGGV